MIRIEENGNDGARIEQVLEDDGATYVHDLILTREEVRDLRRLIVDSPIGKPDYVAQWYAPLTGTAWGDPKVIYGSKTFAAQDPNEARELWESFLDVDLFDHVYTIVPGVGFVEYDLDKLPASWNFTEVVLVDLQEAADA